MSSRWTTFDIDNLKQKGLKVCGFEVHNTLHREMESKKSKYRNVKSNGFDSKKEEARYNVLKSLAEKGLISELQSQVRFDLKVNDSLICFYKADFVYRDIMGMQVVEDVKSEATKKLPVYRMKKKLMMALHGIEIREV